MNTSLRARLLGAWLACVLTFLCNYYFFCVLFTAKIMVWQLKNSFTYIQMYAMLFAVYTALILFKAMDTRTL